MNKNSTPRNNKGKAHGHWEMYHINGQLNIKGNYINNKRDGYWVKYFSTGETCHKGHYVKGKRHGYCEYYYHDNFYYKGYYDMGKKVDYVVVIDTPPIEMFPIH